MRPFERRCTVCDGTGTLKHGSPCNHCATRGAIDVLDRLFHMEVGDRDVMAVHTRLAAAVTAKGFLCGPPSRHIERRNGRSYAVEDDDA